MTNFILDTLAYTETLKAGGFTAEQAATQARALAEILDRQMATKAEIDAHEDNLRRDIENVRVDLKRDIAVLRLETKRDIAETNTRIAESKAELTRWVIGAGLLQTTVIVGVLMKVAKLI